MTPPSGPTIATRPGMTSRVIQGFFPGGRPTILQASPGPAAPLRLQGPGPVQARQISPPAPVAPGRLAPGGLQPKLRPFAATGSILATDRRQGALKPSTAPRAQPPQPVLPQAVLAAPLQPKAGNTFALPASFTLKPRGSGQPLPEPIQKKMESLFNTSFADVRVHVGHEAPSIGALAFAHGTDLYFAPIRRQTRHRERVLHFRGRRKAYGLRRSSPLENNWRAHVHDSVEFQMAL
jgi:Domain of unknown function (DUF4157)